MIFARFAPLAAIALALFFVSAGIKAPAGEVDRVDARFEIYGFAQTDAAGVPVLMTVAQKAGSFATQNGIIGNVVYEDSVGGARVYSAGVSPSTQLADQSLDGVRAKAHVALHYVPSLVHSQTAVLASLFRDLTGEPAPAG